MRARAFVLLAVAGVALPGTGEAQGRLTNDSERLHDVSIDVGGLTLRRRAEPWRSAVSVVPHWRTATPDGALYVGGAVSGTQNGYESAYGTLGLELTPHKSRAPWDLAGTATVLSARETEAIGLATLRGRKHWMSERQGAWLGVTLGGRAQEQTQFGSVAAEASIWRSLAPTTTFVLSASATQAGDFLYYEYADAPVAAAELSAASSPATEFRVPHTARFGEVTAALRHVDSRLEVSLDGRYRMGPSEVLGGSTAFTGDVAFWLTSRYALVGLLGRQLADPTLGTATTMYASIGLRIAARSLGARSHASMPREPIPTRRREAVPADLESRFGAVATREIELAEAEDGAFLLLNVPATTLEIAGDFSGWEAVTLIRRGGRWRLPTALPPGVYRVIIRADGADWRPPNGFPKLRDDFGGEVGVLTIR
jgi:hypothetical protein